MEREEGCVDRRKRGFGEWRMKGKQGENREGKEGSA
jgi:hypothetical protein